jgi:hypothetical protein
MARQAIFIFDSLYGRSIERPYNNLILELLAKDGTIKDPRSNDRITLRHRSPARPSTALPGGTGGNPRPSDAPQKKEHQGFPGAHLSGRWDSNPRPLGPEPSALAGLRYAPIVHFIHKNTTFSPQKQRQATAPLHSASGSFLYICLRILRAVCSGLVAASTGIHRTLSSRRNHVSCRFAYRREFCLNRRTISS